jgi:FAD-dependent sensor of blue light
MIRVIYSSRAVTSFSAPELDALLGLSQANNSRDGITGHLLHVYGDDPDDAWFAQALEGDEEQVDQALQRITRDELHRDLETLRREPITQRRFPGWAMGLEIRDDLVSAALPAVMRSPAEVERLLCGETAAGS